jgi:hypothetical protein
MIAEISSFAENPDQLAILATPKKGRMHKNSKCCGHSLNEPALRSIILRFTIKGFSWKPNASTPLPIALAI